MTISEACRGRGPYQGADVVDCEDGRTIMIYAHFASSVLIALLPSSIVRAEAEVQDRMVRNAHWTIHPV